MEGEGQKRFNYLFSLKSGIMIPTADPGDRFKATPGLSPGYRIFNDWLVG
jgi:hypothetical protein